METASRLMKYNDRFAWKILLWAFSWSPYLVNRGLYFSGWLAEMFQMQFQYSNEIMAFPVLVLQSVYLLFYLKLGTDWVRMHLGKHLCLQSKSKKTLFLFTNKIQSNLWYPAKFLSCGDEDIIHTQWFIKVVGGSWASELFEDRLFLLRSNTLHSQPSVNAARVFCSQHGPSGLFLGL